MKFASHRERLMKLAIFMDPISKIKPKKDSTVAMIKSAQKMGWFCACFTASDLFSRDGHCYANMVSVQVEESERVNAWAKTSPLGDIALNEFDIILVRKDPPFDMEYIFATYALDLAERDGVLIANRPQSLRDSNEKFLTLHYPQCCPPTLVSRDIERLRLFWEEYHEVIFKPLDAMGGHGVFHVAADGRNLSVTLEMLTKTNSISIMAQQYIPEIRTAGDKRILLINGDPVPFGLARIPKPGEARGNLVAGAKGVVTPINDRDRWICREISPMLKEKGLYFVGIDVIGDYLTEINVTSPTCIREIEAETGLDIAGDYLRFLSQLDVRA